MKLARNLMLASLVSLLQLTVGPFDIPSIPINDDGTQTLDILGLTCTQFAIEDVTSSYNSKGSHSLSLGIDGIVAHCSGEVVYHYELLGQHQIGGTITAGLGIADDCGDKSRDCGPSFIKSDAVFSADPSSYPDLPKPDYMATNATVTATDAGLHFPYEQLDLQATSDDGALVKLFAGAVNSEYVKQHWISPAIYSNLTPLVSKLGPAISPLITNALRMVDGKILSVVSNSPSPDPPVPSSLTLVDWQDAGRVQGFMLRLNKFIASHMTGNNSPGIFTCGAPDRGGLDGLIDKFTNSGAIHHSFKSYVNTTFVIPGYAEMTIGVEYLNVSGLDTLTNLTVLEPTGAHSLTTGIAAKAFNASVGIVLEIDPIEGGVMQGISLKEHFDLGLDLGDIQLFARLFLGVDADSLKELTVFQILDPFASSIRPNSIVHWPCALSTLWNANVTDMKTLLNLKDLYLHASDDLKPDSLEAEVDKLIDDVLSLFVGDYNELVTDSLYGIIQGPVRELVNKVIGEGVREIEDSVEVPCEEPIDLNVTNSSYFHFDESKVLTAFGLFVNTLFGVTGINNALECSASFIESTGILDGTIFTYENPDSGLKLIVKDLNFGHIGNLYKFKLLVPEKDHYHLINDLGFGDCGKTGDVDDPACSPFKVGATIHVDYPGYDVHDTINVSLAVGDFGINLGTNAWLDVTRFGALKMGSLSDPNCLLTTLSNFSLYNNDDIELGGFEAQIHAILSSKKKEEFHRIDKVIGGESLTSAIEGLLGSVFKSTMTSVNDDIDYALYAAPYLCANQSVPPIPSPDDDSSKPTPLWFSGIAMIVYAAVSILAVFIYVQKYRGRGNEGGRRRRRRRRRKASKRDGDDEAFEGGGSLDYAFEDKRWTMEKPLLDPNRGQSSLISADQGGEEDEEEGEIDWQDSLMFHPSIPAFIRYAVPVTLAGTIVIFITANLGVGASVDMKVTSDGKVYKIPSLFAFTLANSVHDMWQAGVYPLSVMIALCSGGWPYLKLLLMLFSWTVPIGVCSVKKRENLLMWLDALGKYSLVDAYVLVMMMVAFRFHIALQENGLEADVLVTPEYGFYGFLLATMTSLAMGHIILAFHRHAVADYTLEESGPRESIMSHTFKGTEGGTFKLKTWSKATAVLTLIAAIALLGEGVCRESFEFTFKGAAGLVLAPEDRTAAYSVLSLGGQIPAAVEDPEDFGIRWIEITYYIFALGMPFGCLAVMLALFVTPLTKRSASRMYVLAEVCNAWSAMEVFMISVIAALLEIQQFAAFIVGDKCDPINAFLEKYFDVKLEGDDVCFDVVANLAPDCAYLFTGAALNTLVSWGMLRLAHSALEERLKERKEDDGEAEGHFVNMLYGSCLGFFFEDVEERREGGDGRRRLLEEEEEGDIYSSNFIRGPKGGGR